MVEWALDIEILTPGPASGLQMVADWKAPSLSLSLMTAVCTIVDLLSGSVLGPALGATPVSQSDV